MVIALFASVVIVSGAVTISNNKRTIRRQKEDLDYLHSAHPTLIGYIDGIGNYCYFSPDGGEHWFEAKRAEKGYRILGEADPAKVQSILSTRRGWRTLSDLAAKRGPLNPADPEIRTALEDVGFTVEARKKPENES